eukprot:1151090-Pelagomonas_calceolata.AAC.1
MPPSFWTLNGHGHRCHHYQQEQQQQQLQQLQHGSRNCNRSSLGATAAAAAAAATWQQELQSFLAGSSSTSSSCNRAAGSAIIPQQEQMWEDSGARQNCARKHQSYKFNNGLNAFPLSTPTITPPPYIRERHMHASLHAPGQTSSLSFKGKTSSVLL